tara:strand:- start:1210 stop:1911 length:702 start_codon:yes stop_codon:yes gene_type:complete
MEKMRIEAYTNVKRNTPRPPGMTVMFNPTSFQENHKIEYEDPKKQAINTPGKPARYAYTPPGSLSFKFTLDGTGVNYFGVDKLRRVLNGESVKNQIAQFKTLCLKMNGDIHEPQFLKIIWGDIKFSGRLKTLDITFKLFDESGDPIRAELDVSFVEDKSIETIFREASMNSPDLTHIRTVKSGDTLPFLCKQIYGSSKHYLFIARANSLDDFRNLIPGQKLNFPPLQNEQGQG